MRSSRDEEFMRCGVKEMGSSADGKIIRWEVHEIRRSLRDREFSKWDVYEMGSSEDGEFRRSRVQEIWSSGAMEFTR